MIRIRTLTIGLLAASCISCSDGVGVASAVVLEKVSTGDEQSATAGNRLAYPLVVRVIYEDGTPVGDARVNWTVNRGVGAILSSRETVTDGSGLAPVFLTLGPTSDTISAVAFLANDKDQAVAFTAYAVEPPALKSVVGSTVESGDTITIIGSALSDSTVILFNYQPAQVLGITETEDTIFAIVPPCLQPGPVHVRARVGSAISSPLTALYSASTTPPSIGVGEYVTLDASESEGCLLLGASDNVIYVGAVQALVLNGFAEDSFLITRGDTALGHSPPVRTDFGYDEPLRSRFDAHLRSTERRVAERFDRAAFRIQQSPALPPEPPATGSRRTFCVCNRLACEAVNHFSQVEAAAQYVGDYVVIYADIHSPAGGFSDQQYESLGELFDEELFPIANRTFGAISDLDRNGRVNVLLTPVVNSLTSSLSCLYGYVPGFFLPTDLDPTATNDPRSNQAEILYLMVPDTEGAYGCAHSVDRVEEIIPVTFVHELQHAISFYQHVIVRGGSPEVVWLNEGLSHLAEDVVATHFRTLGDELMASQFEIKNLTNVSNYLREPGLVSPVFTVGSGTGRERGAAWLFIRWVLDVYGNEMARQLVESSNIGVENLASATGVDVEQLLTEWFLVNVATGFEDLSTHHLRKYSSRDYRAVFQEMHRQNPAQFPKSYPLEPVALPAYASLRGNLRSGSGEYYRVLNQNPVEAARLRLIPFDGVLDPDLAVKIHVLRIR